MQLTPMEIDELKKHGIDAKIIERRSWEAAPDDEAAHLPSPLMIKLLEGKEVRLSKRQEEVLRGILESAG